MAEFQEVMKQYRRMCRFFNGEDDSFDCGLCPLSVDNNSGGDICDDFIRKYSCEAEEIIMKWAAEHPEPTYPHLG